jgi:hypothetical protein
METAIAVRETGLAPMGFNDLKAMGQIFEQSNAFGFSQQGQGIVVAMTCVMNRMTPLEFMERYNIIGGKPSMKADAMLANLLELGGEYEIIARDPARAAIKASFRSASITVTLSWDEAKQEPFVYKGDGKTIKTNWATPRARMQMLWARVVSDAVRTVCPLANRGSYTPEEMQDIGETAPTQQATPRQVAPTAVAIDAEATVKPEPVSQPSAEQAKPEVITPEVVAPENVDYSTMPVGAKAGTKWSDPAMTDKMLAKVLTIDQKVYPQLTDNHKKAVQAEIDRRAAEAKQ